MTNPRHLSDPSHPLWSFLELLVLAVCLTVILYKSASNFDATEIKSIIAFLVGGGAIKGLGWAAFRRR